jgi:hypothetical protein
MTNLNCSRNAKWVPELDLDSADGFRFMRRELNRSTRDWGGTHL